MIWCGGIVQGREWSVHLRCTWENKNRKGKQLTSYRQKRYLLGSRFHETLYLVPDLVPNRVLNRVPNRVPNLVPDFLFKVTFSKNYLQNNALRTHDNEKQHPNIAWYRLTFFISKGPASRAGPFEIKKLIDIKQFTDSIFHCRVFLMHYFEERKFLKKVILKRKSGTKFGTRFSTRFGTRFGTKSGTKYKASWKRLVCPNEHRSLNAGIYRD